MYSYTLLGETLFKYRSYTPLLLGVTLFVNMKAAPSPATLSIALLICFFAELLRSWSVKYATGGTRTREAQTHPLCTTGPYAIVRNPLYVANILLYSNFAWLLTQDLKWGLIAAVIFSIQYALITHYEKELCFVQFAEHYQHYVNSVPGWIPVWITNWKWDDIRTPSKETWSEAFTNERRSLTAILIVWVIFGAKLYFNF
jgi:protein-S-isoprenylcysteine O-methyltransferase Ste14